MKLETKVAIIEFAHAVQELAAAVMLTTGMDTASTVTHAAQQLIQAVNAEKVTP